MNELIWKQCYSCARKGYGCPYDEHLSRKEIDGNGRVTIRRAEPCDEYWKLISGCYNKLTELSCPKCGQNSIVGNCINQFECRSCGMTK